MAIDPLSREPWEVQLWENLRACWWALAPIWLLLSVYAIGSLRRGFTEGVTHVRRRGLVSVQEDPGGFWFGMALNAAVLVVLIGLPLWVGYKVWWLRRRSSPADA